MIFCPKTLCIAMPSIPLVPIRGRVTRFLLLAGIPNMHALLRDHEELVQFVAMDSEHLVQSGDLVIGSRGQAEPKVDHASVRQTAAEDQLTEVTVIGDDDPLLAMGNPEDLRISQGMGIIVGNGGNVMVLPSEGSGRCGPGRDAARCSPSSSPLLPLRSIPLSQQCSAQ